MTSGSESNIGNKVCCVCMHCWLQFCLSVALYLPYHLRLTTYLTSLARSVHSLYRVTRRVSLIHISPYGLFPVLIPVWILTECSSSRKVTSLAVLLLPFGQATHVALGRFSGRPEVCSEGEEVEEQHECDRPLKDASCRCHTVALLSRVFTVRTRITIALTSSQSHTRRNF